MSRIKVDRITDKAGTGAPTLVNGMNVTGKSTMGNIVGAAATFNSITAGGDVTFGANVSIGGTLTYEDVTNIDSVGLITARTGIKVTAGGIDVTAGGINVTAGDVDITNGSLGVGLNNPGLKLHIQDGALPSAPAPNGNCDVVIEGTTNTGIQFLSGTQTQLRFGDADSTAAGAIIYKHTDDNFKLNFSNSGYLSLNDGGGENLRFTPNNEIGIAGANYGTSGQVLTSGGSGAAVQWADAGGGAWEVLSHQNFATTNASFSENKGWTTNYQTVKCCFSMIRRQHNNVDMHMRWYMDTSYGNNGTLKSANEYKYGSRYRSWNTDNYSGSNNSNNAWRFFNGNGGQYWSGEITFRIGTGSPNYNFTKYAWGFVERTDDYGNESCRYDADTNMAIVGARLYNPTGDNWTEGTCTWIGLKGQ